MTEEGKYIYCIAEIDGERHFSPMGIGGRGDEVSTVCYRDIATVISNSPIKKYSISRENALAHQLVMEEVMKHYTILPVRFGTIAEDKDDVGPEERIREEVLRERYTELKDLLEKMDNKIELGMKALWKDMDMIFKEIVDEHGEIKRLQEKIADKSPEKTYAQRIKVGEMVKSALEAKKDKEGREILDLLKRISVDHHANNTFGDRMIINTAFLVEADKEKEFDDSIDELTTKYDRKIKFKYVGPVPPCNFVEITITW